MSEQPPQRPQGWSSRAGFILATIGSAAGLGSIWKFPYEVGENGGAGFLLFYGLGLLLVVLPLALAELAIGRRGGGDAPASMARLAAEAGRAQRWGWASGLAIATGFAFLSYYAVIGGLTLAYFAHAVLRRFAGADAAATRALFTATVDDPVALAAYQAAFLVATAGVVVRGIAGGIELTCSVLMPLQQGLPYRPAAPR